MTFRTPRTRDRGSAQLLQTHFYKLRGSHEIPVHKNHWKSKTLAKQEYSSGVNNSLGENIQSIKAALFPCELTAPKIGTEGYVKKEHCTQQMPWIILYCGGAVVCVGHISRSLFLSNNILARDGGVSTPEVKRGKNSHGIQQRKNHPKPPPAQGWGRIRGDLETSFLL